MRVVVTVLVTLLVLAGLSLLFIYSGVYNVAATAPDWGPVSWALDTTMERSVSVRADAMDQSLLDDEDLSRRGSTYFNAMCAVCHPSPGMKRSAISQGLYPKPPLLGEEVEEFSPGQLKWIVQHGIKFTAMPAFGPTHSEEDLQAIVAFMIRLPGMTESDYQEMLSAAGTQHLDEHNSGSTDRHGEDRQGKTDGDHNTTAPEDDRQGDHEHDHNGHQHDTQSD